MLVCNDENEGTQIFFASRRHVAHITRATAGAAGYCPLKKRPQKLQPLASSVFLEHGRTRWPRTPQAAHVLQQYAWSSAGAGATSLHQTAGCMLAADIICCCLQAAGPRERPQQIMKQCSTHACPVCFAVPQWHVFVCNIFLKPVATHASPHSSWTRSTIVRPVAAAVGPTGSASGRTGPTKTLQTSTPSMNKERARRERGITFPSAEH